MEKIENNITTQKIVSRDSWRIKNYKESLRGYQVREDILKNMFLGLDFKALADKEKVAIADIGCGPGICGEYLTEKIKEKLGDKTKVETFFIDISQKMLEQIPEREKYNKINGDIMNIPLKNESVDIITIKQVLDYLPKDLQIKALEEIYRVLKKDRQFILSALISPNEKVNNLTNDLYSGRERIIAKKVAIEKFIPDKATLIKFLQETGFDSKILYEYDIPLSTEDFKKSFNLTEEQQKELREFYDKIVSSDKNNYFKGKNIKDDIELFEKAIILKNNKQ